MGDDAEDQEPFLPLRLFYAGAPFGPRDRHELHRERALADRMSRQKEQWDRRGRERGDRGAATTPGRVRGLSRADIVDVAVAIADAEGTEAVSMRRIARDLRVGAMSLYWHVESKEELHQLMLETVQAEIEAPEPSGDWRTDLAAYATNSRAALLNHPWAIDFVNTGPPSGPNDARNAERLVGALDGLGLDAKTTMWILATLGTYVMGAVLREIQELRWHRDFDQATSDMTEEEVEAVRDEFEQRIRQSGRYPHLMRIFEANFDPDAPETSHDRFWFGLGCLLDGFAAAIAAAGGQPGG
ncbi:MAG TPA: TetR/AcrR family transcriptional regulator [Trebonia sp.]|nr:TetR/AcrR family transcriptional regulator [Trebonia sp.]